MRREDLRVWHDNTANLAGGDGWWGPVSDAELAEMGLVVADEQITWNEYLRRCAEAQGWVEPPDCQTCEGDPHKIDRWTCHVCGGSGFEVGVFVSRSQLESWLADSDKQYDLEASFERLLDALHNGEDE